VFRTRIGQILSLAVASLSFSAHLVVNAHAAVNPNRHEIVQSCFAGVDYTRISVSELSALIGRAVAELRARGSSDTQIVQVLGYQIGKDAHGCSLAQITGLMRNVSLILNDLGLLYSESSLTNLLLAEFSRRFGALSQEDGVAPKAGDVYG
jgi:hypothetical protein